MSIQSIGLKNFTVFKNFQLDVSSGINIFVGENGTGKTHLLKAVYAACETTKGNNSGADLLEKCFKKRGSLKLRRDNESQELDIYLKANCNNKEYIAISLTVPVVIKSPTNLSFSCPCSSSEKAPSRLIYSTCLTAEISEHFAKNLLCSILARFTKIACTTFAQFFGHCMANDF